MSGAARDHALGVDAARLVEMLRDDRLVDATDEPELLAVGRALAALFHHEFLAVQQRLRRAWGALERDGRSASAASDEERGFARDLLQTLRRLLQRANFVPVPVAELVDAMKREAAFSVAIDVDLADFEELAVWRRRVDRRKERVTTLFGLRSREIEVDVFDRLCIYARFKGRDHFADPRRARGKLACTPGGVALRLFRDVPRHDLETLFPGGRVRMRKFDRALIGLPAAAGVLHFLVFKIGTSLGAIVLALLVFAGLRKDEPELKARALGACVSLAVLFAFLFRQWMRFLGRKNLLHRQLAEHLQTRTLDVGLGVLLHLLDEAEQAETAEALLAWVFLVRAGRPLPPAELDAQVEEWLARRLGLDVDFEEDDALAKLERLGLVARAADGSIAAVAPARARALLEARWHSLLAPPGRKD